MFNGESHTENLGANFSENQFVSNEDFRNELQVQNEQLENQVSKFLV